ncbi:protein kinase family protein [Fusobacterium sp.]|uniref:protein kinase family protein n=1 Tax=Fusobacterium sp. TaxID=68766 RepID=UPI0029052C3F|nr:protein kinase family protein [Fusobacterium sp.]MDU1909718.1 protein kinase family protein [Fusobacterium sp.]
MALKTGEVIKFNRTKNFEYLKALGRGGTGDTHLFLDKTTDIKFAIKKYTPIQTEFVKELYDRFVNEIKILFNISHPNIVRIYNYYLYQESYLGYLQMEYIDGVPIDQYDPWDFDKQWDEIFIETISAFRYLESKNILHRDIRPANIMISHEQEVKVIDFGFGKLLNSIEKKSDSVFLNWPVSELPKEIAIDKTYTLQSEIFFLGKIFNSILKEKEQLEKFKYRFILDKMTKIYPEERYKTFTEIEQEISSGLFLGISFNDNERECYSQFASVLEKVIAHYNDNYETNMDFQSILNSLNSLITRNMLEEYIQKNDELIRIFIKSSYSYFSYNLIKFEVVKNFYTFFYTLEAKKQMIVLDNLYSRLSKIEIKKEENFYDDDDEFPF